MVKLNEVTKVTTMNDNDYILMNAADGSTVQIKRADFVSAMADVMRVATKEKNGLMSASNFIRIQPISFCAGVSGGGTKSWYMICKFRKDAYNPIRLLLDYGQWNATVRTKSDITLVGNGDSFVTTGGNKDNTIGYTVKDNLISVYHKIAPGFSLIGMLGGSASLDLMHYLLTEPEGITYI